MEPLGSPSGPANNNTGDWGNATTAFLSIDSDTAIGSVIIHVGDDDHTRNNIGVKEQLGLTGFQLPSTPVTPPSAILTASKSVGLHDTAASAYAIPGEDVVYSITVLNEGAGPVDVDSIFLIDTLPPEAVFFNGDIDGIGPLTGPIQFAQSGAALTFDSATDLRFSNSPTQPTDFASCSYSAATNYDPNIRYVCLTPQTDRSRGSCRRVVARC